MSTIAELLSQAEKVLAESGITEPRREAISLVILATKRDKTFIYARPEYELTPEELAAFRSYLERRASREPLQYISSTQEFFGLDFEVTPDVLIPRPETEMLVERAIELLGETEHRSFCDIGTGSGCIPISVLHNVRDATAVSADVSPRALEVAWRNADRHGVSDRLELVESDLFAAIDSRRFSLIVSNPPYVPARDMDGLQPEVRDHEPHSALTDGSDGLSIIRRIVTGSPEFLISEGSLLLEIGIDQADEVAAMFDYAQWHRPDVSPDLQGIPRLVSARLI